ncbi:Hypothetical predicted protein [Pelobates cultripes]|uniref:Uncharacterized protein n=1 Tax=Pelobates cultripes TaxID=61616 RepID=A0AAD1SBC0_PELCU|nr:Hypothetical predicted protein [Pelobates cultripes]
MDEIIDSYNYLSDQYTSVAYKVADFQLKLADVEDRSCRNNVHIWGIPDSVSAANLEEYFKSYLVYILTDLPACDRIIDRIHRLPEGHNAPPEPSKDTIEWIHFFHHKNKLMLTCRMPRRVPDKYVAIAIYSDPSSPLLHLLT